MHSQLEVAKMLTTLAQEFCDAGSTPDQIAVAKLLAKKAILFLEGASK